MPTFDTPEPISVTVELGVGDLRIVASDRTDTMVEVRPSDAAKKADVTAAEQTRVEYAGGWLLIKAPKNWRQYSFRGGGESIDVQIELPAGSHLRGETGGRCCIAASQCMVKPRRDSELRSPRPTPRTRPPTAGSPTPQPPVRTDLGGRSAQRRARR